ncbi:hypothetical protein OIV83_001842 [Microbotryomycetes sp. JL201]|nr:hypothetical protein OIV83_001842 [Microbotryomycetes sp. JL201]
MAEDSAQLVDKPLSLKDRIAAFEKASAPTTALTAATSTAQATRASNLNSDTSSAPRTGQDAPEALASSTSSTSATARSRENKRTFLNHRVADNRKGVATTSRSASGVRDQLSYKKAGTPVARITASFTVCNCVIIIFDCLRPFRRESTAATSPQTQQYYKYDVDSKFLLKRPVKPQTPLPASTAVSPVSSTTYSRYTPASRRINGSSSDGKTSSLASTSSQVSTTSGRSTPTSTNRQRPMDPRARKRYERLFDQCRSKDPTRPAWIKDGGTDAVDGLIVRQVWLRSKLSQERLGQIWLSCTATGDSSLHRDEFCQGMWMIDEELRRNRQGLRV